MYYCLGIFRQDSRKHRPNSIEIKKKCTIEWIRSYENNGWKIILVKIRVFFEKRERKNVDEIEDSLLFNLNEVGIGCHF